ncbi:MAG TPA: sulfurtransferase TusA family protein, partial [Thermoplasmata archaeon]|nr:sulfurtransferase TusA family protein [Thermoplasmata archaeon]
MNVQELAALKVEKTIDARGTACPGPLLEAKRGIATVPIGGLIEVLSSDEATGVDV